MEARPDPAPADRGSDHRYTAERYFGLVAEGVLDGDERVELLEGVIVAMSPQSPGHAGTTQRVARALRRALGEHAEVREDKPLLLGPYSVPEPDVSVVPAGEDYLAAHPSTALLVVEVADTSLAQDRVTKAAIYAGADISEYWIVNLRDGRVEVHRRPDSRARRYDAATVLGRGGRIELVAFPGVSVSTDDLLPPASA